MKEQLDLTTYQQIAEQFHPLTESEAMLHAFIVEHFEELSYYGITDLAQKVRISKATIGRYLNKLGYTGYAEFKTALRRDLMAHNMIKPVEANRIINKNTDTKTESLRFITNICQLVDQFSATLNIDEIDKLVKLIADKSRRIYVIGPASSQSLAIHFSTLLKYTRSDVYLLPLDRAELPKALLGITEHDILLAFSYYRFSSIVLDVTKYFNSKNAHVTVVTNTSSNPYTVYSTTQHILPSDVDSIFYSRTIVFLFVELLLALIQRETKYKDNFEELENLFKFFGTFSSLE
ncbi:MAG: MurR/RpiR family transcriptional regulator [Vibrio sp.]|uniref:MurR/RpiR family transcriptional regulator n=1 Tax=Vibrio sp. TaxID=678 RepID=UPI003A8A8025